MIPTLLGKCSIRSPGSGGFPNFPSEGPPGGERIYPPGNDPLGLVRLTSVECSLVIDPCGEG